MLSTGRRTGLIGNRAFEALFVTPAAA